MKIVLTTLPHEGEYTSWITPDIVQPKDVKYIPLGLLSLATNIPKEHTVKILDPYSEGWSIAETVEKIQAEAPDVIGFSAITRRLYSLYKLLELTRAPWKIVGGPHCTNHYVDIRFRGANTVFVGSLVEKELAEWLKEPYEGIIYCDTNVNNIAFPDRTRIDYKNYFHEGKVLFEAKKRMPMFSSVGCPNRCVFCSVQSKKVAFKKPGTIMAEMQHMVSLGAESIHILDDNFNINRNHVNRVLDEMERVQWKTEWSMRGQVRFDLSLVPRMKKCGLKRVHVGIESLDDNTLKWFGKNHTVRDIEEFCKVMNQNDIEILGYFIVGTPGEADAYLASLPDKIKSLGIKHPYVNVLFPEPDTAYYEQLVRDRVYLKDLWAAYMHDPTPGYVIPAPYGEDRKDKIMAYATNIIKDFM